MTPLSVSIMSAMCWLSVIFLVFNFANILCLDASAINSTTDTSSQAHNGGLNALGEILSRMKSNHPLGDNNTSAHLHGADLERVVQRILTSDRLDELRALFQRWHNRRNLPSINKVDKRHIDPDVKYNMSGLIWSKGYPVEEYEVKTEDGYILGLFRIPHGKHNANVTGKRPVVFLQHGLLACSTNWVSNLANQSLGFILADAGYDVWMGNMRGNTYSRRHVHLSPDKASFWQFSWDQMARYDIPAMLNFALQKSGQSQLAYVGHSQGTLVAFTGLAINQDLAKKVTFLFALGPVYTVGHVNLFFREIIDVGLVAVIADVLTVSGLYEFLPSTFLVNKLAANTLCAWSETEFLCQDFFMFIAGYSVHRLNESRVPVYITNNPAGTSLQNMEHFTQMVYSGKCLMYNYGIIGNLIHYNQPTPPSYPIEKLTVPVALFWGADDELADPEDVAKLRPRLRNLIYDKKIDNFEHLDFIWAIDAKSLIYDDILSIMKGVVPPQPIH